tara:strand:- start:57 stop:281 length:225 start_codon:yes stop_codon:yes gene_type:complete
MQIQYPTYYRTKAIKRRQNIEAVKDFFIMLVATIGLFVVTSGVVLALVFIAFGFTAPDGFGIQLPFGGYFWESK